MHEEALRCGDVHQEPVGRAVKALRGPGTTAEPGQRPRRTQSRTRKQPQSGGSRWGRQILLLHIPTHLISLGLDGVFIVHLKHLKDSLSEPQRRHLQGRGLGVICCYTTSTGIEPGPLARGDHSNPVVLTHKGHQRTNGRPFIVFVFQKTTSELLKSRLHISLAPMISSSHYCFRRLSAVRCGVSCWVNRSSDLVIFKALDTGFCLDRLI